MIYQKILTWNDFFNCCLAQDRDWANVIVYGAARKLFGVGFKYVKIVADTDANDYSFYIYQDKKWHIFPIDLNKENCFTIGEDFCNHKITLGFKYSLAAPINYFIYEILEPFEDSVREKTAKAMDYKDYRSLKSFSCYKGTICIDTDLTNKAVFHNGNRKISIIFPPCSGEEKTFSDFLKREFFSESVDKNVMTNTTSSSTADTVLTGKIATATVSNNNDFYSYITPTPGSISDFTIGGTDTVKIDPSYLTISDINAITLQTNTFNNNTLEKKENKKMKGFNFDFGPVKNDSIRMSMYGLAIKNLNGTWVSYNTATNDIIDVDVFNFDGSKFLYKMPVAIAEIAVGDVVMHMGKPMFVVDISEAGEVMAIDVVAGEKKIIMPTRNCFGFNYATKVVSLFNMTNSMPSPDAPFGNMLPFLMMDGENTDMSDMMLLMMLNSSTDASNPVTANPMMMYLLAKGDNKDMLPLMLLMNNNNNK